MISETEFAQRYTSLWHQVLPMADSIVRRINVSYEQFAPTLTSKANPRRRAYVNELAFRIFAHSSRDGILRQPKPDVDALAELEQSTAFFISRLRSADEISQPDLAEREEALLISRRLFTYFAMHEATNPLSFAPKFAGCGILNTCVGDIVAEPTLYEVKAGARDFRLIDVRQVVTYCALNFASRRYLINRVVLLNPRRGISAMLDIHEDLSRASGSSASEVYADLLDFLSQDISPNEEGRLLKPSVHGTPIG